MPCSFPADETADYSPGLPEVRVDLANLRANWRFLRTLANDAPPLAVVKADAYGHGLPRVAQALLDEGCSFYAVGSVAEALVLRETLNAAGDGGQARILPMLGLANQEQAAQAWAHGLVPFVHSPRQAALLNAARQNGQTVDVAVKVDTGMSRLGFRERAGDLAAALRSMPGIRPRYVLTHLASADDPGQRDAVTAQIERFREILREFQVFWPDIRPSMANSAGLLDWGSLAPDLKGHIPRPGYALYGGNPFAGTVKDSLGSGLKPVMQAAAPVLAVHALSKGSRVSYGSTFTADRDMRVAVVGAGYADGLPRSLSSKGRVCIRGRSCPILGRVCMQMHIVDVSHLPDISEGDQAFLLGGEGPDAVSIDDLARTWGTIPYEVMCVLGRNRRVYRDMA